MKPYYETELLAFNQWGEQLKAVVTKGDTGGWYHRSETSG